MFCVDILDNLCLSWSGWQKTHIIHESNCHLLSQSHKEICYKIWSLPTYS